MQTTELCVEVDQLSGHTRQPAFALIGRVGDVHRVGDCPKKRLEALFRLTLFSQLIQFLLGLDDLLFRLAGYFHARCFFRDVFANLDQFTTDRHVVDHLRIVTSRKRRDRSAR